MHSMLATSPEQEQPLPNTQGLPRQICQCQVPQESGPDTTACKQQGTQILMEKCMKCVRGGVVDFCASELLCDMSRHEFSHFVGPSSMAMSRLVKLTYVKLYEAAMTMGPAM